MNASPGNPADWPGYCCCILRDPSGLYLVERRPATARAAAGRVTCFGGGRERDEAPDACVRRELREELAIEVGDLRHRVTLVSPRRVIAWFYEADVPGPGMPLTPEPGHEAIWLSYDELLRAPLADWHRLALTAERTHTDPGPLRVHVHE